MNCYNHHTAWLTFTIHALLFVCGKRIQNIYICLSHLKLLVTTPQKYKVPSNAKHAEMPRRFDTSVLLLGKPHLHIHTCAEVTYVLWVQIKVNCEWLASLRPLCSHWALFAKGLCLKSVWGLRVYPSDNLFLSEFVFIYTKRVVAVVNLSTNLSSLFGYILEMERIKSLGDLDFFLRVDIYLILDVDWGWMCFVYICWTYEHTGK